MNISELITKLTKLQLEQDDVIRQLTTIARDTETNTKNKDQKPKSHEKDTVTHAGDHVLLLTGGVLCRKGDTARVTKTTTSVVHFVALRNNHHVHKKYKNVRKAHQHE